MARTVGKHIQRLRLDAKMSQERLAEMVGVHRTQIGFLERGENTTSMYNLDLIAKALGKRASVILDECGY